MKRLILSAAGLIAAVSMGTALAAPFALIMNNKNGDSGTASVMKIGSYCTTNPIVKAVSGDAGYTAAGTEPRTISIALGGLKMLCGDSCTIQLYESKVNKDKEAACDGTVLGSIDIDTTVIGMSGTLFKNQSPASLFKISDILPSNQGVTITTRP